MVVVNKNSNRYAGGKIKMQMRLLATVVVDLNAEAKRLGFPSAASYINHHFTEYFKGKPMQRKLNN